METKPVNELTNEELLAEAKKLKSFSIQTAFFIGFLGGIIVYSLLNNAWGLFSLFPFYLIYLFVKNPQNKRLKEVEAAVKERNLK